MADIRVEWNNFRRGMVANDTNRTIITENPEFPEAQKLRDYLQKAPPSFGRNTALDRLVYNYPDRRFEIYILIFLKKNLYI